MTDIWYYEYQVKTWNEIDHKEEIFSGVVPAESIVEAVKRLDDYYGTDIMEIQMLKPIFEGTVFEFQCVMEDPGFDYVINKKA